MNPNSTAIAPAYPILFEQGKHWPLVAELKKGIADQAEDFRMLHDASISLSTEEEFSVYVDDLFVYAKLSGTCDDYSVATSIYVESIEVINEDNETISLTAPQQEQIKKAIIQLNIG